MFQGLDILVPFLFVTFASIFVGGFFVVFAWVAEASEPSYSKKRRIPAPLYALAAASSLPLIGYVLISNLPSGEPENLKRIYSGFILAGFAFLLISIVHSIRHTGGGRGTLLVGSATLLTVNVIGLLMYLYMYRNR